MTWPQTLPAVLDRSAEEYPDTEAVVGAEERLTYAELRERVESFARGLLAMGVGAGDHVGLRVSNRIEWFVATYAIQAVGATMVGLNTWYQPDELRYALRQTDVSTLVTLEEFAGNDYLDQLQTIDPEIGGERPEIESTELPQLQRVVTIDGHREWTVPWNAVFDRGERVSDARLAAAKEGVAPEDDAYVLFSSGTTGRPKPIVLAHDGIATNPRSIGARLDVEAGDRFWLGLPLFFSFAACNESVTALSHGATLVLQEQFDPDEALDRIAAEDVTVVYAMPNMLRTMEDTDRDLGTALSSVRVCQTIGPSDLRERFEREHGVETVLTCYGLTEVSAVCVITDTEAPDGARFGTEGAPLANVDVRIVDPETDLEVPPGERGEVRIRARTLFREYYGKPEETRAALDGEGYLKTGDAGRLSPGGRLVYEGRFKDMIKTGGINVSPGEVERVLEEHEHVREATVVGVPDEEKDEVVAAAVRPVASLSPADIDTDAVRAFARERLSSYKVPETIAVYEDDFPRTDTGKVRKAVVEEKVADERRQR